MDRTIDVVCVGEALVDFLPSQPGPLPAVPSFERHPGGAPANVAIGAARLGARSALVGAVGEDPFGSYVLDALADEGVDVRFMVRQPRGRTGLAFVSLDEEGRPRFYAPSSGVAELALSPEHVARVPWSEVLVLHFSTALLRAELSHAATFEAVRRAKGAGCLLAFDPNLRLHHLTDTAPLARDLAALVPLADLVKLSSDECEFVTGTAQPKEAARRLVEQGASLVVVTCGAGGCVWARPGEDGAVSTRRAALVDTTGAGDGFQAALVTALARRGPLAQLPRTGLEAVLATANEAGTRVCEKLGAVAGLARATELDTSALGR